MIHSLRVSGEVINCENLHDHIELKTASGNVEIVTSSMQTNGIRLHKKVTIEVTQQENLFGEKYLLGVKVVGTKS